MTLELEDIWFKYSVSKDWVLKNINITVKEGSILLVGGPTGSGKTTLSYVMSGIIPRFINGELKGIVKLNGKKIETKKLMGKIGYVFQNFENQLLSLSVRDEILITIVNNHPKNVVNSIFEHLIDVFSLRELLDRYVYDLSFGEMQRVALASMMGGNPKILIMDEPMAHIDEKSKRMLVKELKRLRDEGYAIVVFEHRIKKLKELADTLAILKNGEIIYVGDPTKGWVECEKHGLRASTLKLTFKVKNETSKQSVIIRDLWVKRNPSEYVLRGLNLTIESGKLVIIYGENGAGKTTLALTMAKTLQPDRGKVKIIGDLNIVFQNPDIQLIYDTVLEEVYLPAKNSGLKDEQARKIAEQLLKSLGLWELRGEHPLSISKGQRYRLALASILASKPRIIILDEPTFGQDLNGLKLIFNTISRYINEHGATALILTSDEELFESFDVEKYVLENGKLRRG